MAVLVAHDHCTNLGRILSRRGYGCA